LLQAKKMWQVGGGETYCQR